MNPTRLALVFLAWPIAVFAEDADRFAPIAPLVGHCWRAPMSEPGMVDLQCFEWMFERQFVRNTHVVSNPKPIYSGETIFRYDPDAKQLGFHYFTSTGALSQGHLQPTEQGYLVPETHVGADGKRTELRSRFELIDATHFRVRTEILEGEAWGIKGERLYTRVDAIDDTNAAGAPAHD